MLMAAREITTRATRRITKPSPSSNTHYFSERLRSSPRDPITTYYPSLHNRLSCDVFFNQYPSSRCLRLC